MLLNPQWFVILLATAGVLVAGYIHRQKRAAQALVCPLHANCETVVHSEFSSFFGIPVELLGLLYYAAIIVTYVSLWLVPVRLPSAAVFVLLALTTGAFLFSVYLTFIQAFTLREWCSWCLCSAALSTGIFWLTLWSLSWAGLSTALADVRPWLLALHLLSMAIGLGGATMSDVLFLRFLRDFKVSAFEADVLRAISQVIWLSLAFVVMTGVGLYLPEAARLNPSSKFLLKVTVVAVLLVNGAFLNLYISPRLVSLVFSRQPYPGSTNMEWLRRLAFALGGVSIVSWYSAFTLGVLPALPIPYGVLLLVYLALLAAAVTVSQVFERRLASRAG